MMPKYSMVPLFKVGGFDPNCTWGSNMPWQKATHTHSRVCFTAKKKRYIIYLYSSALGLYIYNICIYFHVILFKFCSGSSWPYLERCNKIGKSWTCFTVKWRESVLCIIPRLQVQIPPKPWPFVVGRRGGQNWWCILGGRDNMPSVTATSGMHAEEGRKQFGGKNQVAGLTVSTCWRSPSEVGSCGMMGRADCRVAVWKIKLVREYRGKGNHCFALLHWFLQVSRPRF